MLPADHALGQKETVTLAELAQEPIPTDQAQSWQHVLELFQMHGMRPQRAVRTGLFELQRDMVANGLGVAMAYSRPFNKFNYDGRALVRRPISDLLPLQRILLVHHQRMVLSTAHQVFIEETRRWFAATGWGTPAAAREAPEQVAALA